MHWTCCDADICLKSYESHSHVGKISYKNTLWSRCADSVLTLKKNNFTKVKMSKWCKTFMLPGLFFQLTYIKGYRLSIILPLLPSNGQVDTHHKIYTVTKIQVINAVLAIRTKCIFKCSPEGWKPHTMGKVVEDKDHVDAITWNHFAPVSSLPFNIIKSIFIALNVLNSVGHVECELQIKHSVFLKVTKC